MGRGVSQAHGPRPRPVGSCESVAEGADGDRDRGTTRTERSRRGGWTDLVVPGGPPEEIPGPLRGRMDGPPPGPDPGPEAGHARRGLDLVQEVHPVLGPV